MTKWPPRWRNGKVCSVLNPRLTHDKATVVTPVLKQPNLLLNHYNMLSSIYTKDYRSNTSTKKWKLSSFIQYDFSLICMRARVSCNETQGDRMTGEIYLRLHSKYNNQSRARLKPEARSFIWSSHEETGAQSTGTNFRCLPGTLAGSRMEAELPELRQTPTWNFGMAGTLSSPGCSTSNQAPQEHPWEVSWWWLRCTGRCHMRGRSGWNCSSLWPGNWATWEVMQQLEDSSFFLSPSLCAGLPLIQAFKKKQHSHFGNQHKLLSMLT